MSTILLALIKLIQCTERAWPRPLTPSCRTLVLISTSMPRHKDGLQYKGTSPNVHDKAIPSDGWMARCIGISLPLCADPRRLPSPAYVLRHITCPPGPSSRQYVGSVVHHLSCPIPTVDNIWDRSAEGHHHHSRQGHRLWRAPHLA